MVGRSRWRRFSVFALGAAGLMLPLAFAFESIRRVPAFYRAVDELSSEECTNEARQFVRQSTTVFNQIENETAWSGVFRERQVNAWLAWDFARKHADILPRGVTNPRVSFDDGRITIGFHMHTGPVRTIVSARGRVWLPEPNFVAVELETVRAGALPLPAGIVVQNVTAAVQAAGLQIEWRQHAGKAVALVRLAEPNGDAAVRVDRLEMKQGLLYVAGRSARGRSGDSAGSSASGSSSEMSLNRHKPAPTVHR